LARWQGKKCGKAAKVITIEVETIRKEIGFVLLILIGLFFTYKAIVETVGIDLAIGHSYVALVAFVYSYLVLKKK